MKKTAYFTPESISEKAEKMLEDIRSYSIRRESAIMPDKSALIVLDMQNYFLDPLSHAFIPSASSIVPNIQDLIEVYQENHLPIVLTRHVNSEKNAGLMSSWWKDIIRKNTPRSEISDELTSMDKNKSFIYLEKSRYDAFSETPLQEILMEQGIKQVVITGVMTHLCCESSARSAFMRGFEVFFPVECTATYHENFHRATLLNLSHGFSHVMTFRELMGKFEKRERP